ncbi:MAG TPA: cupredoxin domain-containing protein [Gemmatimonadaceae bacterium]
MNRILIAAALAATASVAGAQAVTVTLTEWKVAMSRDTVHAGPVTFRITNNGTITPGLYVRGDGVDKGTKDIPARQSTSLVVTVKAGTYDVFCPMSDESHKLAGMKHTLVVLPADPAAAKKPDR